MSTFIDIHVLQSVPPSNINRDDSGSPKTATYGGVLRHRVSSQAWKRATRIAFEDVLDSSDLGIRTSRVAEILAKAIADKDNELEERSQQIAEALLKAAGMKLVTPKSKSRKATGWKDTEYLLFLSANQIEQLAAYAISQTHAGNELATKDVKRILTSGNSIDLALFGRMIANGPDMNVDAACQVAHALSVHAVANEYDYFTAVDDAKDREGGDDAGAGMLGTVEFNSSTLYRYATINVDQLEKNLGTTEATRRAITAFVRAFALSMPTGKQNTFANRTVPDVVTVQVRSDQPVSLVGAFERPVAACADEGYVTRAVEALGKYNAEVSNTYGLKPDHEYVVSLADHEALDNLGDRMSFTDMLDKLNETLTDDAATVVD